MSERDWMAASIGDEVNVLTTAREAQRGRLLGVKFTDGGHEVVLLGHPTWEPERVRYVIPVRNIAIICVDLDNEEPF